MTNEEAIQNLAKELKKVADLLDSLRNNATIPYEIGEAFKTRILSDTSPPTLSSKSPTSENQGVNEAGTNTYSVLGVPDGFVQVQINGTTYYLPYYS